MRILSVVQRLWVRNIAVSLVGALLLLGTHAAAADKVYVVKRNDTLYGIARKYGLRWTHLADYNHLSRSATIYVGQRLRIPSGAPGSTGALGAAVQAAIDKAKVRSGRWKHIVIHHSGVSSGTVKGMDEYHRERRHMEHGLAYHFVIGNGRGMRDGEVAAGQRWFAQLDGGHLASAALNKTSIGICLVGNFDKTRPTSRQMASLKALVSALCKRCSLGWSAVKTHQQINTLYTRCPGRNFPWKTFLGDLKAGA